MTPTTATRWESMRTDETRAVEDALRKAGFAQADAYRYNAASIRVRVVDSRFEGLPTEQRDAMVEPHLEALPERTQADILSLYTFAPSELTSTIRPFSALVQNTEFVDPSPSML